MTNKLISKAIELLSTKYSYTEQYILRINGEWGRQGGGGGRRGCFGAKQIFAINSES